MLRIRHLIGCLLTVPAACLAARGGDPSSEVIVLRHCAIEYERQSTLASPTSGVIQECLVKPGDQVQAGQVIGRLRDQDVRAEMELRAAEAANDTAVRVSVAKYAQLLGRLRTSEVLSRRQLLGVEEFNLHKLEAETARVNVEEAKLQQRLAGIKLRQSEALVRAREFVSPHDGLVVDVYKNPGESLAANEPSFQIVNTGRMKVVGYLDVGDAWRVRVGQEVCLIPEIQGIDLPVEKERFPGRVAFVDHRINPKTHTCKVIAYVDNRGDLLRSGLEGELEISPAVAVSVKLSPENENKASPTPPRSR